MNEIKWEHYLLVIVLLLLTVFGFIGGMKRVNRENQEKIDIQQKAHQEKVSGLEEDIKSLEKELEPLAYSNPLENLWVSSTTGYRKSPLGGAEESLHKGVDLVGDIGAPVYAVLPGLCVEHWLTPGMHNGILYHGHPIYGAMVVLKHESGLFSVYGHLSATYVREGQWIEQGQIIGELGNTGISTGPHLHWEIVVDGLKYLEGK